MNSAEKDVVREIAKKIRNRYDVDKISKKLVKEKMEENSFLIPVACKDSRTTKSVPRRGFTSISIIEKG